MYRQASSDTKRGQGCYLEISAHFSDFTPDFLVYIMKSKIQKPDII